MRKVDADTLSSLLQAAGFAASQRSSFLDAEVQSLPAHAASLATTTDLIYDFGAAPMDFGYVAVSHALSDLYAVLARPLVTTIALGVPPSAISDGTAAAILRGYRQALMDEGVEMGGGHTVYASDVFVGVTAVGVDALVQGPDWVPHSDVVLLISKPLGSGIYLSARAHDLLDEAAIKTELIPLMRETNARAASDLQGLAASSGRRAIAFVTDVTGFGLLLALEGQLRRGCRAEVRSSDVPMLERVMHLIANHGLATILGEHSMLSIHDDSRFSLEDVPMTMRLALSDPQTSGGLLAAVSRSAAETLRSTSPDLWTEIGTVHVVADDSPPHVTVL